MTTAQRLAVFGVAIAIALGAGAAIGTLVGPIGPAAPMNHSTGLLPETNGVGR
jgi:hypothetical protein